MKVSVRMKPGARSRKRRSRYLNLGSMACIFAISLHLCIVLQFATASQRNRDDQRNLQREVRRTDEKKTNASNSAEQYSALGARGTIEPSQSPKSTKAKPSKLPTVQPVAKTPKPTKGSSKSGTQTSATVEAAKSKGPTATPKTKAPTGSPVPKKTAIPKAAKSVSQYSTKEDFMYTCIVELTKDAASDEALYPKEYAKFLFDYCSKSAERGPTCDALEPKSVSLSMLPIQLQFLFVTPRCNYGDENEQIGCLQNFLNDSEQADKDSGTAFKYEQEIETLCEESSSVLGSSGLLLISDDETQSPTIRPDPLLSNEKVIETASESAEPSDGSTTPLDGSVVSEAYKSYPKIPGSQEANSGTSGSSLYQPKDGTGLHQQQEDNDYEIDEAASSFQQDKDQGPVLPVVLVVGWSLFVVLMAGVFYWRKQIQRQTQNIDHNSPCNQNIKGDESILSETSGSVEYDEAENGLVSACTKGTVDWENMVTPSSPGSDPSTMNNYGGIDGTTCRTPSRALPGPDIIHIVGKCTKEEVGYLQLDLESSGHHSAQDQSEYDHSTDHSRTSRASKDYIVNTGEIGLTQSDGGRI